MERLALELVDWVKKFALTRVGVQLCEPTPTEWMNEWMNPIGSISLKNPNTDLGVLMRLVFHGGLSKVDVDAQPIKGLKRTKGGRWRNLLLFSLLHWVRTCPLIFLPWTSAPLVLGPSDWDCVTSPAFWSPADRGQILGLFNLHNHGANFSWWISI